jgi:hypothetical protein
MIIRTSLLSAALALFAFSPAFAEPQAVTTESVTTNIDGGTTTTTTRYYYDDRDANHNGILDSDEFGTFVYSRWDMNGDGFIDDTEWTSNTARWYPPGYTEYKTYTYWDKNGDGHIDATEFGPVVAETDLYGTWDANADKILESDEYAAKTFSVYDSNSDGSLNLKEWQDSLR